MTIKIYIDAKRGSDLNGDGSRNKPYQTLEYFCISVADKEGGDYTVYLGEGTYEITKSTIFGDFLNGVLTIIGVGGKTEIVQKTGMYINTVGGSTSFTLNIARCRYNILTTLTSYNLMGFRWKWNFYNVLFEYTPDNSYSVFSTLNTMEFRNCVKLTNTTGFLRKNDGTISVYDSVGYFTSGYSTSQADWDISGNVINSIANYKDTLDNNGRYRWKIDKYLIFYDGKYRKYNKKVLAQTKNTNLVPVMTSNTTPSGKVTAGHENDAAWGAFDDGTKSRSFWYTNNSNATNWLQYEFENATKVTRISLASIVSITGKSYGIRNFTILGSNDGVLYDILLTDVHPNSEAEYFYDIPNPSEYTMYKIKGDSYYSTNAMLIGSFKMFGEPTPYIPAHWSIVKDTLPSSAEFNSEGMESLSIFDRTVTKLEPIAMMDKSEILGVGKTGKVFSKTIDLKNYLDIRNISVEVK